MKHLRPIPALLLFGLLACCSALSLSGQTQRPSESASNSETSVLPDAYVLLNPVTINPGPVDPLAAVHLRRTRYNVRKVYPYAVEALIQLAALDSANRVLDRRRDQRRYRKDMEKALEAKFKQDIKKLSRSQGAILIDILERQTGTPFYSTLKEIKSGATAFMWQALGKHYGYDLKEGYDPTADPVLEALLQELTWPPYPAAGASLPKP